VVAFHCVREFACVEVAAHVWDKRGVVEVEMDLAVGEVELFGHVIAPLVLEGL